MPVFFVRPAFVLFVCGGAGGRAYLLLAFCLLLFCLPSWSVSLAVAFFFAFLYARGWFSVFSFVREVGGLFADCGWVLACRMCVCCWSGGWGGGDLFVFVVVGRSALVFVSSLSLCWLPPAWLSLALLSVFVGLFIFVCGCKRPCLVVGYLSADWGGRFIGVLFVLGSVVSVVVSRPAGSVALVAGSSVFLFCFGLGGSLFVGGCFILSCCACCFGC
ncbi:hypothetical protein [Pseudomonas syringae]|uniref:hypothetical protein n=1 Tax=Pseudomonas syringae TaxID=317 RepID=UPI001141F783|nr:hypothetical protein [Pseudomonas syringae]